jgi:hypothetical protein
LCEIKTHSVTCENTLALAILHLDTPDPWHAGCAKVKASDLKGRAIMKNFQQQEHRHNSFKNVPVVRLDSGAVRIPVELIDNIAVPKNTKRVLRITVTSNSFCAWR